MNVTIGRRAAHACRGLPVLLTLGCAPAAPPTSDRGDVMPDVMPDASMDPAADATPDASSDAISPPDAWLTAVTFNTGSSPDLDHDGPPDDGYGAAEAALTDAHYGNGLAWVPFVEATRRWLATVDADLIAFQEIFHPGGCADVPPAARAGFVCAGWAPGDPTVVQRLLAPADAWQVACHPGRPDKCLAVRARLGRIAGCDGPLCLDGLEGHPVEGCGRGARVARGVIELADGGRLVVVSVHGTSGFSAEDEACRVARVEQVFVGGPAPPLARTDDRATPVLILGDLNTDPGRVALIDDSAARWLDFVGPDRPFRWLSPIGPDAPRGYGGVFDIDHQIGRGLVGDCHIAGLGDPPPVMAARFFDHRPVICALRRAPLSPAGRP